MARTGDPEAPPVAVTESHSGPSLGDARARPEAALVVAHTATALNGRQRHAVTGDELVVGREPGDGGLRVADRRVSRRHFTVRRDGPDWLLTELGSHNGSSLNGRPIAGTARLELGDVIRAGDTLFVLAAACAGATATGGFGLIGESAALHRVRESIERVGASAASVLIQGETGVGKELVARAVHQRSGRTGPFVALNCAAVAETLLESELFGHVRGAFTGATADRVGLFRAADGGTLFLDEVGEMPARLQVQLLRVLETRTVRPVGAWQELPSNVRVVAATHRDLIGEVREQRLRSDLYARLAQWHIDVPPLRDRREDVPLLVGELLDRHGAAGCPVDVALVEALLLARWPLNVRGLANVVAAAVLARAPGAPLQLAPAVTAFLDSAERLARPAPPPPPPPATPAPELELEPEPEPATVDIESLTRADLHRALEAARGNIAAAARILGCTRQQLYRLFQRHALDVHDYRRPPVS